MRAIEYMFERRIGGGEVGEWWQRGLCAQTDPDEFFPERGGTTRHAKRICSGCDVRADCLEYALANDERFGVWAGLSVEERDREASRRQQGLAEAA